MNIENYNLHRQNFSPLVEHNNAVYGFWLIGRWYNATMGGQYYYGAYPPSYLKRLGLLFPDIFNVGKILHLFSGTVIGDGERIITLDINPEPIQGIKPDIIGDAEELDGLFSENKFDLIVADPPYGDNYIKYGTKPINRKKIVHLCSIILKNGGFLVWLDTIIPQWAKRDGWVLRGMIGLAQSTNHAVRSITILQKQGVNPKQRDLF